MKKKLFTLLSILIALSMLLAACGSSPEDSQAASAASAPGQEKLSGTISVSGVFALYPMMTVWADEFQKLHPDVQFDVQGGGAGKGMTDTIAGAVDIGMISRSIKPEEESQGIFWVPVTKDAVFPIISDQNPVKNQILAKGITQDIFSKIFITGEIKTWGEVIGDPSVTDQINVYTRSDSAGAAEQWAKFSGGKAQDELKGHRHQRRAGHGGYRAQGSAWHWLQQPEQHLRSEQRQHGSRDCSAAHRYQYEWTGRCRGNL